MKLIFFWRTTVLSASLRRLTATPSTNTDPSSGDSRHPSKDNKVVLPLPEGPITKERVPGWKARQTSRRAQTRACAFPNDTLAPSTARKSLGTEHSPRLNGKGATHRNNRRQRAHGQARNHHGAGQPPRARYPGNQRFRITDTRDDSQQTEDAAE